MKEVVRSNQDGFFTIKDICYCCWCHFLFSSEQYDAVDAILSHSSLYTLFEKLRDLYVPGGDTCLFCGCSSLAEATSVKEDVRFIPNRALNVNSFDDCSLDELFLRMSSVVESHEYSGKLISERDGVYRGFNVGVLAVHFVRMVRKDKKYFRSFAKNYIKVVVTDNVVSHVKSTWESIMQFADEIIEKLPALSDTDEGLNKKILTYSSTNTKLSALSFPDVLNIYKRRLIELVMDILDNECESFQSDYLELFRYLDAIYQNDNLLFEQLLRMQICVSFDIQERLKITDFVITRDVMTFTGFYNKYERGISQTSWSSEDSTKSRLSVEECICRPLKGLCDGKGYKFMASGREDFDVRTTGTGRKLCVEVYSCKRDPFYVFQLMGLLRHNFIAPQCDILKEIVPLINWQTNESGSHTYPLEREDKKKYYFLKGCNCPSPRNENSAMVVRVPNRPLVEEFQSDTVSSASEKGMLPAARFYGLRLSFASKTERKVVQIDAENKNKDYSCVVFSDNSITFEELKAVPRGPIMIAQANPLRTSHRKHQRERQRTIYDITIDLIHPRVLLIHLKTQAGTYIKEFVNGDQGRTNPSISSFLGGKRLYVTHLDVVGFC